MKLTLRSIMAAVTLAVCSPAYGADGDDPLLRPIAPGHAARWLGSRPPVRLHGNSWVVGFEGLSVLLIDSGDGLILIDGAVPQAVPAIEANIASLGFRVEDIELILSTEPHYDHAGGIAALARDSGATVVASEAAVEVLRRGRSGPDDPQAAHLPAFPAVERLRAVADGEVVRLGNVEIVARATPGHTAGSMSWSWRSCDGERCADIVFAASLNPVSADGYRFTDPAHHPVVTSFRRTFAAMRNLPCDILVTAHPGQSASGNPQGACRAYADASERRLDARLAEEVGAAARRP
jgi:metallo-beta-lactamase class B